MFGQHLNSLIVCNQLFCASIDYQVTVKILASFTPWFAKSFLPLVTTLSSVATAASNIEIVISGTSYFFIILISSLYYSVADTTVATASTESTVLMPLMIRPHDIVVPPVIAPKL